jgi:hypothetical protein
MTTSSADEAVTARPMPAEPGREPGYPESRRMIQCAVDAETAQAGMVANDQFVLGAVCWHTVILRNWTSVVIGGRKLERRNRKA